MLDMTKLGFEAETLDRVRSAPSPSRTAWCSSPGPTGSGKTNTLYSAHRRRSTQPDTNIMTAEDPVEFNLPGINQVQMRSRSGSTSPPRCASFLRQDPNIILVGEIRDYETAEIAVKAALTGHLVLSTLHTNDAPSTVSRLVNMGIEPFLVATSREPRSGRSASSAGSARTARRRPGMPAETLIEVGFPPEDAGTVKLSRGGAATRATARATRAAWGCTRSWRSPRAPRSHHGRRHRGGAAAQGARGGDAHAPQSGLEKIRAGITTIEEVLRETIEAQPARGAQVD